MVITLSGNRTIKFVYDASGAKLEKITNDGVNPAVTYDYVNGVEYKGGVLQRIAHPEGEIALRQSGNMAMEYVLRDHLGNARVVFSDTANTGVVTSASITQINHYYAFGMNMEGNWNGASGNNKYQYNEKEWNDDFGLGMNDYGARWYDPAMARWGGVDPMAEKMGRHSPYNYGFDNPVRFVDPSGMDNYDINQMLLSSQFPTADGVKQQEDDEKKQKDAEKKDVNQVKHWTQKVLGPDGEQIGETQQLSDTGGDCGCPHPPCAGTKVMEPFSGGFWAWAKHIFWDGNIRLYDGRWVTNDGAITDIYDANIIEGTIFLPISGMGAAAEFAAAARGGEALKLGEFTYTESVAKHFFDFVKSGTNVGLLSRPYLSSGTLIEEIMASGKGVVDATFKGGMNWKVAGTFRGSQGIWELGINPETKVIYHLNFVH